MRRRVCGPCRPHDREQHDLRQDTISGKTIVDPAPRQGGADAIHTHGITDASDGEALSVLPGLETLACQGLAVPQEVMHHVVRIESSFNPYAIGVVGGRLVRQPRTLAEALSTARMLEQKGYNFSLGLAQVNRYNLEKYGLGSYEKAFEPCSNLVAGSRILAECHSRSGGDWGKSFSCYYSGNFSTGFRHGYVQKIYASIRQGREVDEDTQNAQAIAVVGRESRKVMPLTRHPLYQDGTAAAVGRFEASRIDGQAQGALAEFDAGRVAAPIRRPSRVEAVVSRRVSVDAPSSTANASSLEANSAPNRDPAYVASQSQTASIGAAASAPAAPSAPSSAALPSAATVASTDLKPSRSPVVLQPYSGRISAAAAESPSTPAPRVSVPPVDRAPRKTDEAFVF